ncbi:hypothetical protein GF339_02280, partial [candidate division KSB3 bacterium]|nr:hypothetical protein [candidate division KSB3 bacterium]MBD3323380.1 hypothetical protein [candidate division KSB3 bacterium]
MSAADAYLLLIILQIGISLATIGIVYRIGTHLWGSAPAFLAAFLLSLDLASTVNALQILTDTLFTCVLTLAVWMGLRALSCSQKAMPWIFFHGLCLTIATLIRPIAYYLIVPELLFWLLVWIKWWHWSWKTTLVALLTLLTPWIMLIGGWHVRNYLTAGTLEFSSIQAVNLLF